MFLISRIKEQLGLEPKKLLAVDEIAIQGFLAATLRAKAIEHLDTSDKTVADGFRGQYIHAGEHLHGNLNHVNDFLNQQGKDKAWGTYIEATALGEALGCHVVVTDISSGEARKPYCLYNAGDNDAEIIHLKIEDNKHWSVNNKTNGDGNCLYNAFAQALQKHVVEENRANNSTTHALKQDLEDNHPEVIAQRKILSEIIKTQPTPKERATNLETEKERVKELPPEERIQIAVDHEWALKLAREEVNSKSDSSAPEDEGSSKLTF